MWNRTWASWEEAIYLLFHVHFLFTIYACDVNIYIYMPCISWLYITRMQASTFFSVHSHACQFCSIFCFISSSICSFMHVCMQVSMQSSPPFDLCFNGWYITLFKATYVVSCVYTAFTAWCKSDRGQHRWYCWCMVMRLTQPLHIYTAASFPPLSALQSIYIPFSTCMGKGKRMGAEPWAGDWYVRASACTYICAQFILFII